jgi:hypothetical protein
MNEVAERADGATGNERAQSPTDDEKTIARARELVSLYRSNGVAGHHGRCLEITNAAHSALSNPSSTLEELQEGFAKICAIFEVAPESARLGVESRGGWRAREQAIRTMAWQARLHVPWTRAFSASRPTAPACVMALARAVFPRGKLLQAPSSSLPEISSAKLDDDGSLVLREGLDVTEKAAALAWGIAALAMKRAKATGPLRWDERLEAEAADRLALAIVTSAGETAEKLRAVLPDEEVKGEPRARSLVPREVSADTSKRLATEAELASEVARLALEGFLVSQDNGEAGTFRAVRMHRGTDGAMIDLEWDAAEVTS